MSVSASTPRFLAGGGACARLIEELDWAATPLGPIAAWPASLTSTVANMLHARQPMLLFWGAELTQLYNDAFVPSFGRGRHPTAMGQPARACWIDAWPVIGAQIEAVMTRGEPSWHEDALVPIDRNGRMEEAFWTYSYSPAFDDAGAVVGTLVIVTETTGSVLATRRLRALAQLSLAVSTVTSYDDAFAELGRIVMASPTDVPLVVVCEGRDATVAHHAGISDDAAHRVAHAVIAADPKPPLCEVALEEHPPCSAWPEPVPAVLAASLGSKDALVVFGISPRLPLDDGYRSFIGQLADLVASALARADHATAAEARERQRDNLLLHAPVATALMIGPRHVYQLANALYCAIVGRDPTGKAYVEAFPELVGTALPGILDRVYTTGEPFVVSEMHVPLDRRHTGTLEDCYFNFNLEPLRDEADRIYGMMAVAVDITDQVRARQTLERIGEERARVMVALETANRTKDEFLAMLGHELRNPLAPIVTAIELMNAKDPAGQSSPERAVIERQVKHVVRLVDDLLDVSKISRGVMTLQKRIIDLARVVADAIETGGPLIEQRRHRLTTQIQRGVLVEGDPARLVQIVSNLLSNAARYTPPGGEISVTVTATPADAIIEVADNGSGIAPALFPRIFDAFVQGTRSTDRAEGGLGLGLSIVKNLVALHGGEVTAESEGVDRGSVFRVRLPRAASTAQPAVPARRQAPASATKRVLLVDDNADAADLLGEIVRLSGHDVTVAHDPAEALAAIAEVRPEVAVLDLGLPGMDGFELAGRIHAEVPACRLIALTGYGQDSDRARTTDAGFSAHLVKPVDIGALLELLIAPG